MKVRSMRGVEIDMNRVRHVHGDTPAVGNAKLNGRGDVIGRGGRVVRTREAVLAEYNRNASTTVTKVSLHGLASEIMQHGDAAIPTAAEAVAAHREKTPHKEPAKSRRLRDE